MLVEVSKEQFCLILDYCKDFEHFYVTACELAHNLVPNKRFSELANLEDAIRLVGLKYNTDAYIRILEYISFYTTFLTCGNFPTEYELQLKIVKNFNKIFPNMEIISKEYKVSKYRIDILAKEKGTNKHVIFELKKGNSNPNPQLRRYSKFFKDPILIAITEKPLKDSQKENGIIYYTFSDLRI